MSLEKCQILFIIRTNYESRKLNKMFTMNSEHLNSLNLDNVTVFPAHSTGLEPPKIFNSESLKPLKFLARDLKTFTLKNVTTCSRNYCGSWGKGSPKRLLCSCPEYKEYFGKRN